MAVSKSRKEKWQQRWDESRAKGQDPLAEAVAELAAWKADPLGRSSLSYWLKLEVWTRTEALMILSGVVPDTVQASHDDAPWVDPLLNGEWLIAQPFSEHYAFSLFPEPLDLTLEDFGGNAEQFDGYLERREKKLDVLTPLRNIYIGLDHKLKHSPSALGDPVGVKTWRPVAFLSWAKSINFRPSWFEWAERNGLIPDQIEAIAAPFFDAEADSYPELLHIAVRAWEAAKESALQNPISRCISTT